MRPFHKNKIIKQWSPEWDHSEDDTTITACPEEWEHSKGIIK